MTVSAYNIFINQKEKNKNFTIEKSGRTLLNQRSKFISPVISYINITDIIHFKGTIPLLWFLGKNE